MKKVRDRRDPKGYAIYRHTNRGNGKCYIGLTEYGPKRRWVQHVRAAGMGSDFFFHRAIRKYGPEAFDHEVLEYVPTLDEANQAETKWIAHFNSNHPDRGYNLDSGGRAYTRHEETKIKIGRFHRSRWAKMAPREKSEFCKKVNASLSREARSRLARSTWDSLSDEEKKAMVERLRNCRTTEQRSAAAKHFWTQQTSDTRAEWERRRQSSLTPEKRSQAARKRAETMGHERMSQIAREFTARMTPEQLKERSRKRLETLGPEGRSALMRKSWETRRRKAAEANKSEGE